MEGTTQVPIEGTTMRFDLICPLQPLKDPGSGSAIYHRRLGWGMGLKTEKLLCVYIQTSPHASTLQKQPRDSSPHIPDPEHSSSFSRELNRVQLNGSGLECTRHSTGQTQPPSLAFLPAYQKLEINPPGKEPGGFFSGDAKRLQRKDIQMLTRREFPIRRLTCG